MQEHRRDRLALATLSLTRTNNVSKKVRITCRMAAYTWRREVPRHQHYIFYIWRDLYRTETILLYYTVIRVELEAREGVLR